MKHIGIDIGMKNCTACIMDDGKDVLEIVEYPNTLQQATAFARIMAKKYGECAAVCESTGNMWLKTFDALEKNNIPAKLANPMKLKAISEASTKTDKVDAKMLARLLAADMIPECHVPDRATRGRKQVLRHRISLVQDRTRVANRTGRMLDKYDVRMPHGRMISAKNLEMLAGTRLPDENDGYVLRQNVKQMENLNQMIADADRTIRGMARMNEDARLIMSMTGIDAFGALLIALEIDGVKRFDNPKKLVSWAGLCPTVHQSGRAMYHGRMKKDSNRRVNWMMIQAANVAVRHDERMKEVYERARKSHPHQVAISHVANKMITIIWHMLQTRRPYDGKKDALYARKLKRSVT